MISIIPILQKKIELSREQLRNIICNFLAKMKNIKFQIIMGIKYQSHIDETEIEFYHNSKYSSNINETTNIDPIIDSYRDK